MRVLNEGQAARWAAERAESTEIGHLEVNLKAIWLAAKRGFSSSFACAESRNGAVNRRLTPSAALDFPVKRQAPLPLA